MKKFELAFVQDALDRLVASGFTGVLVGGHAVNFWALGELGLRVWHRHGVEIEKALPIEAIAALSDERLQKFAEVRLPQLVAQLKDTRQRYLESLTET